MTATTIGLDIAKSIFQVHGEDGEAEERKCVLFDYLETSFTAISKMSAVAVCT
jgi:hypothetical protein